MATQTFTIHVDDLDGERVEDDDLVVRELTVDGATYRLDLRTENSKALDRDLARWLDVAAFVGGKKRTTAAASPSPQTQTGLRAVPNVVIQTVTEPAATVAEPEPEPAQPEPVESAEEEERRKKGGWWGPRNAPFLACPEPNCDRLLKGKQGLVTHQRMVHGVGGPSAAEMHARSRAEALTCPECAAEGKSFTARSQQGLAGHRRIVHDVSGKTVAEPDAVKVEADVEPSPEPEPEAERREPIPLYKCEVEGCPWPGSVYLKAKKAHERMKHGLGGLTAAEMKAIHLDALTRPDAPVVTDQPGEPIFSESVEAPAAEREAEADPAPAAPVAPAPTPAMFAGTVEVVAPNVTLVKADKGPAVRQERKLSEPSTKEATAAELEKIDRLQGTALQLREQLKDGLPEPLRWEYYPEVLGIEGMDYDLVESALRHPERVTVAPETFDAEKHYPILRFYKGDCLTVLGMRNPQRPAIIAAYHGSLLAHDTHRVNHVGGGGSRSKMVGLPKTPKDMVNRLRAMGAVVDWDPDSVSPQKAAKVTYKGEDLGMVSVGPGTDRDTVQGDYQRSVRRVNGIDQQEARAS